MVEGAGCDDLPRSRTFLGPAGDGGSRAILVAYCDGVKRATKVKGNPQNDIVLINELVTARLAVLLRAPCPEGRIVEVDEIVLEDARKAVGGLENAKPGLCFGSTWSEASYSPGADICRNAVNRMALAGLIVLYTWCRNGDFKPAHLMYRAGSGGAEVLGLDHGHCFDYTWDTSIQGKVDSTPIRSVDVIKAAVEAADFGPFLETLRDMRPEAISECLDFPEEWGVAQNKLQALERYLIESRPTVIETVKDAFNLEAGDSGAT